MKVIVLGMHRSGTSLACGLLNLAGVHFGEENEIIQANEENPKGFWERKDVRKLNDTLLHQMGCDWSELSNLYKKEVPSNILIDFYSEAREIIDGLKKKSSSDVIGLKEPRLCVLMPFWQNLLDENDFILLIHREPEEIAISLNNRNGLPHSVSNYLTERYMGCALHAAKDRLHYIASFKDLIEQPVQTLQNIIETINTTGQNLAMPVNKAITGYSTPNLYRSKSTDGHYVISKRLQRWYDYLGKGELPRVLSTETPTPKIVFSYQHSKRFDEYTKAAIQKGHLEKRVHTLEGQVVSNLEYRDQLRSVTTDLASSDQEIVKQKESYSSVKATLSERTARLEETAKELLKSNNQIVGLTEQTNILEEQTRTSNKQIEEFKSSLAQTKQLIINQEEQLGTFKDKLRERINRTEELISELAQSNQVIAGQKEQISGFKTELKDRINRTEELISSLAQSDQVITSQKEQIDDNRTELKDRINRTEELISSLAQSDQVITSQKVQIDDYKTELKDRINRTEELISSLAQSDQVVTSQKVQVDGYEVELKDRINQVEKLSLALAQSSRLVSGQEIRIADFKSELSHQGREIRGLSVKLGEKLATIKDLNIELKETSDQLINKNQELIVSRTRQKQLEHEVTRFELTTEEARGQIQDLEQTLRNAQSRQAISDEITDRLQLLHSSFTWRLSRRFISLMLRPLRLGTGPTVLTEIDAYIEQYRHSGSNSVQNPELASTPVLRAAREVAKVPSVPIHDELSSLHSGTEAMPNNLILQLFDKKSEQVKIGLVITEDFETTSAGDYFTAKELATSLTSEFGWECVFLPEKSESRDWHDVNGLDILLVLLDKYDISSVYGQNKPLIKIAWARNWIDRWAIRPWFPSYDLILCTSEVASKFIFEQTGRFARVLKIAANTKSFNATTEQSSELQSDYCFTGNYWGAPRRIEELDPSKLPYDFALYGVGWDEHTQFECSRRGSLPYKELPTAYKSTKILIDDANHATAPWGSVNSRVFDALATGTLVITNGNIGAKDTFGDLLPTYSSVQDLEQKILYFLEHPGDRKELADKLHHIVKRDHNYKKRAHQFREILKNELGARTRIAIKLPVPDPHEAAQWGDFHFGKSLAKALEMSGYSVRLDFIPDWYVKHAIPDDVVLVIRGLSRYVPDRSHLNLLWLISHPDNTKIDEYNEYDHVFVASELFAQKLAGQTSVVVSTLLQCTDPDHFLFRSDQEKLENIIFVGNSRRQLRPIVIDAIAAHVKPQVIGKGWKGLINERFIAGEFIENESLGQFYASSGVLLCDHWQDMKEHGFISNRLFDAAACGAVVVSDMVTGIDDLFDGLIYTYSNGSDELATVIEKALSESPKLGDRRRKLAQKIVKQHSFDARAKILSSVIQSNLALRRINSVQARVDDEFQYQEVRKNLDSADDELRVTHGAVETLNKEILALQEQFKTMKSSYSWRITAPLRNLLRPVTFVPNLFKNQSKAKTENLMRLSNDTAVSMAQAPVDSVIRKLPITALVITWDVGHNPVGRSYMLAEALDRVVRNVIIIGFQFPRYGDDTWEPLRNSRIPIINLPGSNFPEFLQSLDTIADRIDPDVIFSCKARLPSVQLGAMIKNRVGCPLFIDIDDHELTFFKDATEVSIEEMEKMEFGSAKNEIEPYEKLWTGLAQNARRLADEVLVSNEALHSEFGGTIVPHVRDEKTFDPRLFDRQVIRKEFGIPEDARVVLFFGTPRPHKGINLVAKSVAQLNDERTLLVVVGNAPDRGDTEKLKELAENRIKFVQNQPFERIPAIVSMADVICLAQDLSHPTSRYQLPAKAIDAIAMDIPLLATATPPFRRLFDLGIAIEISQETIVSELERTLKRQDRNPTKNAAGRDAFLKYFSYSAAANSLRELIQDNLKNNSLASGFHTEFSRFVLAQKYALGVPNITESPNREPGKDFVLFWKQNDTGLYGRRVDMFIKYLASRDDVRKIVVFDAPISEFDLLRLRNSGNGTSQNRWVYVKTYEKILGKLDSEKISYNVFAHPPGIYSPPGKGVAGRKPLSTGYLPFINKILQRENVSPKDAVFWFYPKNFMAPEIIDHFAPGRTVIDVVDDHRAWPGISDEEKIKLTENYRDMLGRADMVMVNCKPMLDKMKVFFPDTRLIPNGCDSSPPTISPKHSKEFEQLTVWEGKTIGFVGNLEAKIDIELIEKIALRFSECKIILLGSTHTNNDILNLEKLPNIQMPGVVPYEQIGAWIKQFDVGIIPHRITEMTKSMNPLKALVYLQWGLPIVTTNVDNIGYKGPLIQTANTHEMFLSCIERFLQSPMTDQKEHQAFIHQNDWRARFEKYIDELLNHQD